MEALYIEDNVIEQRLMSLYFADMSITLHLAGNGSDGLAIAHKVLPSFIMMDMVIPDMDGATLLKVLKEDRQLQDIPIIIMTADLLIDKKVDVFGLGATACLIKPVSKSRIADILKQLF
jgi:CheY-like chemotaxis protein